MRTTLPSPLLALLVTLAAVAGCLSSATAAHAAHEVAVVDASPGIFDEAMAYADFTVAMDFPGDSTPKSLTIELPEGQLAALTNAATCPVLLWRADACADATRIGSVTAALRATATASPGTATDLAASGPMVRLPAVGTELARFGLAVASNRSDTMYLEGTFELRRDGTSGMTAQLPAIPRTGQVEFAAPPRTAATLAVQSLSLRMAARVGNGSAGFAFNPARCIPATTRVQSVAWDGAIATGARAYTPTACASAPFSPQLTLGTGPTPAATPAPFDLTISEPYIAHSTKVGVPMREMSVTLPAGIGLTAATASGGDLVTCADVQFDGAGSAPSSCPAGSRIGTAVLDSPVLGAVPGEFFLAQPAAGAGADDLLRLFVVAQLGPGSGDVRIKFSGAVSIDRATNRLVATFTGLPDQPMRSYAFTFRGGTAPALRLPRTCGWFGGEARMVSTSTATTVTRAATLAVDGNCSTTGRFRPTVAFSTAQATSGSAVVGTTTFTLPPGDEPLKAVTASLPAGLLPAIASTPRCTAAQLGAGACPVASRVGQVDAQLGQGSTPGVATGDVFLTDAPDAGAIAGLAMSFPLAVGPIGLADVKIAARVVLRSDHGIDLVTSIPDQARGTDLDLQRLRIVFDRAGFMTHPAVCSGSTVAAAFGSALGSAASGGAAATATGCGTAPLTPTVGFSAAPASVDGAASVTATVGTSAAGASPPKRIALAFPAGVSLSLSADSAAGLSSCTEGQFAATVSADPTCPAGSAIGTVAIGTASLGTLTGTVHLGAPVAGHTARVLVDATSTVFGPTARVKVAGFLDVAPTTGRATLVLDDMPPLPFTTFAISMRGGSSPFLTTPRACGTTTGDATLTPHTGAAGAANGALVLTSGCGDENAFAPTLATTTAPTRAGADTTLTATVAVPEQHRAVRRLTLALPAGLAARTDGTPRCAIASATAGTCPAATRIGGVDALAGRGPAPGRLAGGLFLTEAPVAGDAFGIALELPVAVGPIDLGRVGTIASVRERAADRGLDVLMDLPTEAKGIQLGLRQLRLTFDRPGFLANPDVCDPVSGAATLTGSGGGSASASLPLTVTGCKSLTLDPSLSPVVQVPAPVAPIVPQPPSGTPAPPAVKPPAAKPARALAKASFKPSGGSSTMAFALSSSAGISKIVVRMPRGAVFVKRANRLVKPTLTGAEATVAVVSGERRLVITVKPAKRGEGVTKVRLSLPRKAIRINVAVRRVLKDGKASKKRKAKLLSALMRPAVTMTDGDGVATTVALTTKVTAR